MNRTTRYGPPKGRRDLRRETALLTVVCLGGIALLGAVVFLLS